MKNLSFLLSILLLLSGCRFADLNSVESTSEIVSSSSIMESSEQQSSLPISENNAQTAEYYDGYYTTDKWGWTADGQYLVSTYQNTLSYINSYNQIEKSVTFGNNQDTKLFWSENNIVSTNIANRDGMIIDKNGEYKLQGFSVWDTSGNLIKKFPSIGTEPGENSYHIQQYLWFDSENLVLECKHLLLLYSLTDDTITVLDDLLYTQDYADFSAYYGIESQFSGISNNKFYYLAYKDEQKVNSSGTISVADKNGAKELFDGQDFNRFYVEDNFLVLIRFDSNADSSESEIFLSDTDGLNLVSLGRYPEIINEFCIDDGRISWLVNNTDFYCYDTTDDSLQTYIIPIIYDHTELLCTRKVSGQLEIVVGGNWNTPDPTIALNLDTNARRTVGCSALNDMDFPTGQHLGYHLGNWPGSPSTIKVVVLD